MYGRSKHSPKKHHNSNKFKEASGSSSSSKQKDLKSVVEPPPSEDKEIPLPVLKMVDVDKHLQCYSTSIFFYPLVNIILDDYFFKF